MTDKNEWYNDNHITTVLTQKLNKNILLCTRYSPSEASKASQEPKNTLPQIYGYPMKKMKDSQEITSMAIPINLGDHKDGGKHWAALVIKKGQDNDNFNIYYQDSLGGTFPDASKEKEALENALKNGDGKIKFTWKELQIHQQNDAGSCGAFTVENICAIVNNTDDEKITQGVQKITQDNITEFKIAHLKIISEALTEQAARGEQAATKKQEEATKKLEEATKKLEEANKEDELKTAEEHATKKQDEAKKQLEEAKKQLQEATKKLEEAKERAKKKLEEANTAQKTADDLEKAKETKNSSILILEKQKEAIDYVIDQPLTLNQQIAVETTTKSSAEDIDEILKKVRENILQQQLDITRKYATEQVNIPNDQSKLKLDDIKQITQKLTAEKKKEYENALSKAEINGYKNLHETFKDRYKTLEWSQESASNTRTIKNDLCTLTETTKEQQIDGKTVKLRDVNFPNKLDKENGPMHISLAVKDENGRNIDQEHAVYFTAHYDKSGQLKEISYPQPVKFSGEDQYACAYIERGGKIYTLPVTKGKLEEMEQAIEQSQKQVIEQAQKQVIEQSQNIELSQQNTTNASLVSKVKHEEIQNPNKDTLTSVNQKSTVVKNTVKKPKVDNDDNKTPQNINANSGIEITPPVNVKAMIALFSGNNSQSNSIPYTTDKKSQQQSNDR